MKAWLVVTTSFLCSLWFDILPFPYWFNWLRPELTLLVFIYWAMAIPERYGILTAAALGLVMDSLMGAFIGQHLIAYSVVASFIALTYRRLRVFDTWHQSGVIFLLVGLEQLIEYWLRLAMGHQSNGLWFLLSVLMSAMIWPWLMIGMRSIRRQMGLVKHLI